MKSLLNQPDNASSGEAFLYSAHDFLLFPYQSHSLVLSEESSFQLIESALSQERQLFLAFPLEEFSSQRNLTGEKNENFSLSAEYKPSDNLTHYHPVGILVYVSQVIKISQGHMHVILEGRSRACLQDIRHEGEYLRVRYSAFEERLNIEESRVSSLMRLVLGSFKEYTEFNKALLREDIEKVKRASSPQKMVDLIVPWLSIDREEKIQHYLLPRNVDMRLEYLAQDLRITIELFQLQREIAQTVRKNMNNHQRDYFLQEQIKEMHKRLGTRGFDSSEELVERIRKMDLPGEVEKKALEEASRLSSLGNSPEAGIIRYYIDWLLCLPWEKRVQDHLDLLEAGLILDTSHYGLRESKEHILEFLAVRTLVEKPRTPILCLLGPPGTGKTSLVRSMAQAMGRPFGRISLGGMRDEAEIRGHRRTYMGALPGKIIQLFKRLAVKNPLILLDEIDKLASDFRGDPAAALLEVLDPEQNNAFVDHYLEIPYDLSEVLFVATANSLEGIPHALLDRFNVITLSGYTELEKIQIARRFLWPQVLEENGLSMAHLWLSPQALLTLIRSYTRESGVRDLERRLTQIVRKLIRQVLETQGEQGLHVQKDAPMMSSFMHLHHSDSLSRADYGGLFFHINEEDVRRLLGDFLPSEFIQTQKIGLAYGMAWTPYGGQILPIEAEIFEGPGDILLTGKLGDVMKESARIAFSVARAFVERRGLSFGQRHVHLHAPAGAVPKDGPSAGITMAVALVSRLVQKKLPSSLCLSGELSLSGAVLAVGGLREKILAAHRWGFSEIVIPRSNRHDLKDIPDEIRHSLTIHLIEDIEELWTLFFAELQPSLFPYVSQGNLPWSANSLEGSYLKSHP